MDNLNEALLEKIEEVLHKSNVKTQDLQKLYTEMDDKYDIKTLENIEEIEEIKDILKKELEGDNGIVEGLGVLKV